MKLWRYLAGLVPAVCLLVCCLPARAVSTSAAAAVVLCADTGDVLLQSNAQKRLPMASTTKIMTGLLLAEQPDVAKTVTVTEKMVAVEGSSMGLRPGDVISYRDLLYGLLLASGNDAANTAAIAIAGSVQSFVRQMNLRAKALGLKNTSFQTPSGLDGDAHYTTAYDLALLTAEALQNNLFAEVCATKSVTLSFGNPPVRHTLTNHNKLLQSYSGLIGVKTGFTKKAGRCLVTAAERDGKRLIAVTLNDPNDWQDHAALLDYGFENSCSVTLTEATLPQTVAVIGAECDAVALKSEPATFTLGCNNTKAVTQRALLPRFLYAPTSAGEAVGLVEYWYGGRIIDRRLLVAAGDVAPKVEQKKRLFGFWQSFLLLLRQW